MKTVVIFKWCRDPRDARMQSDGSVSWTGVKMSASDDDPAAMQVAQSLSSEENIVGLTVGDGKADWAAARGASSTVVIGDVGNEVDGAVTASALSAAIKRMGDIDVVTIGDSDWDYSVTTALIGKLGWPAYAGVTEAKAADDSVQLTVKGQGESRIVEVKPPVLIIAKALGNEVNPPGMKQTLAARKKPVESISAEDLDIRYASGSKAVGTRPSERESAIVFDGSDSTDAVNRLLDALRDDGVL